MKKFTTLKEVACGHQLISRTIMMTHKTPDRIRKLLVLVEGTDDIPVYEVFFDKNVVDIQDCQGCEVVEDVHKIIKSETKWKYLSIRDCDFIVLSKKKKCLDDNFFYTDCHDSEMMMFSNPGLIKSVMNKLVGKSIDGIKRRICYELYWVSMLKWFNMFRNLKYKFEALDLAHLSWNAQISTAEALKFFVPTKNSPKSFPLNAYKKFQLINHNPDLNHLINGHDFVTRWASIIKTEYHQQYSDRAFRKIICDSYTIKMAKSTVLYHNIMNWELSNRLSVLNYQ
ncbi:MAG: DUF4435 domain-containing protein [Bacteroidales bacterium]|nr:DUF4435 domain-containing protein [Bacteroidales bacterium]